MSRRGGQSKLNIDEWILNGKSYAVAQLADVCDTSGLSDFERRVLRFGRDWQSGHETFTLHTSGSTGEPKPITVTREQMATSARLTVRALGLQPGSRALVCLGIDYIAGMMMLVRGLECGLHLTIVDPVSRPLLAFAPSTRFDFTAMVPLQLQETLNGAPHEFDILDAMQGVLIGGGPVSQALAVQLQRVSAPLYHTYGMTETVSHIALRRLNGPQRSDSFVPFDGVHLQLDERGCLTITSALTRGETLCTNDRVELRPDGTFVWLGRMDNVINSGGVKVQTEKVETALETCLLHGWNGAYTDRRFFVGPLDDQRLGQTVVAVIEGEAWSPEVEAELRARLPRWLTRYEVPRHFFFVPTLTETRTGKIDRRANLAHVAAQNMLYPSFSK
jgi:O-succinylbenzoic acid--CoA ligase